VLGQHEQRLVHPRQPDVRNGQPQATEVPPGRVEQRGARVLHPGVDPGGPNFFTELSYYIATATGEELYRFLVHAQQFFVPLEKLFFGTDYPGFLYDPVALRAKLLSVNSHAERLGTDPIPQAKLDGIMGDNFARMMGWLS
jgi:hypothetical protein